MLFQNNTSHQKITSSQNFELSENFNFPKNKYENPSSKISLNEKISQSSLKSEISNKK